MQAFIAGYCEISLIKSVSERRNYCFMDTLLGLFVINSPIVENNLNHVTIYVENKSLRCMAFNNTKALQLGSNLLKGFYCGLFAVRLLSFECIKLYISPHFSISKTMGIRVLPKSVRLYSVLGGTTG